MKPNSNALETLHHSLKLEWIKQEQTNQMKKTASVEYDGKGAGTSYKMYDTHRPSCLSEKLQLHLYC